MKTGENHRNKLHFKIEFHNIAVFTVFFDQINAALVSIVMMICQSPPAR